MTHPLFDHLAEARKDHARQVAYAEQLEEFAAEVRAGTVTIRNPFGWRRAMFNAPGLLRIEFDRPWETRTDLG